MYLKKLNHQWSAFLEAHGICKRIIIANTTRLNPFAGAYMLELQIEAKRFHLYHTLDRTDYELRILDEAYENTSFEAVLGISEDVSRAFLVLINQFMLQSYAGIQTSVDCSQGLEQAKKAIQNVRLYHC